MLMEDAVGKASIDCFAWWRHGQQEEDGSIDEPKARGLVVFEMCPIFFELMLSDMDTKLLLLYTFHKLRYSAKIFGKMQKTPRGKIMK